MWKQKRFVIPAAIVGPLFAVAVVAPQPDGPTNTVTAVATESSEVSSTETTVVPDVATTAPATTLAPDTTTPTPPTTRATPTTSENLAALGAAVVITNVVDGDTVDLADGSRVRVLGYDTPERGECGYAEATDALRSLLASGTVTLATDDGDDTDKYGRLLRHVLVDGNPVGGTLIAAGMADARYDSLDGYPRHRYQDQYRAADGTNTFACATQQPTAPPATASPGPLPAPTEQPSEVPAGGADLDCADIGRKVWVGSNDYHRLDRDGDGWGCESYG